MNIRRTIIEIETMYESGVIGPYAIGGAVGADFYLEAVSTEDVDVFVIFNDAAGALISLRPIYDYAEANDWRVEGQYIYIGGWPVQFLSPDSLLTEEAIMHAVTHTVDDIETRVFAPEYLMAIALKIGRAKDKARLLQFLETSNSKEPKARFDEAVLDGILRKHDLTDDWVRFKHRMLEG